MIDRDADVLRKPRYLPGRKTTDAAHNEVDLHARRLTRVHRAGRSMIPGSTREFIFIQMRPGASRLSDIAALRVGSVRMIRFGRSDLRRNQAMRSADAVRLRE